MLRGYKSLDNSDPSHSPVPASNQQRFPAFLTMDPEVQDFFIEKIQENLHNPELVASILGYQHNLLKLKMMAITEKSRQEKKNRREKRRENQEECGSVLIFYVGKSKEPIKT